jgi:hypothetical protein
MRRSNVRLMSVCLLLSIFLFAAGSRADTTTTRFAFGVKPGIMMQSSSFGLAYPRWQPYAGIDWIGIAVHVNGGDASASVFIPHVGVKYFLKPSEVKGHIAPYILGDLFFSLASVSMDGASGAEEEAAQDILEFWGLGIAFGAEYYFTDAFSVGGEYGIRYLHDSVDRHADTYPGYGGSSYEDEITDQFSVAFKVTYTAISVNYHF